MAMGLFQILKQAFTAVPTFDDLNDEFYDSLAEALILADVGAETACDIVAQLRKRVKERFIGRMEEVKDALRDILRSKLEVGDSALTLEGKPAVVLVIVRQNEGADPGAVLFDALQAAKARGTDVVLCDTAGRLHNKQNLMNELAKLRKIIDRECPDSSCETLLVLDATTGQNGLIQARTFKETAGLTGIILTKLDGTAKGGIVIAIAQELGVPVKFVGVGEDIDDLKPFDPAEFVQGMV